MAERPSGNPIAGQARGGPLLETHPESVPDAVWQAPGRRRWSTAPWEREAFTAVLGGLLILLAVVRLPDDGIWLRARGFGIELTGIILALWVVLRRGWTAERTRAALRLPLNRCILGFQAWVILSLLRSDLPAFGLHEAMRHLAGGLLYFAVAYGLYIRYLERLVAALVLAAGLGAFLAFVECGLSGSGRIAGAFLDEQLLAATLGLLLPLVLVAARGIDQPWIRLISLMCTVMVVMALLAGRNRSSWVGILAALMVLVVLYRRYGESSRRARPQWQDLVVPVMTAGIALLLFVGFSFHGRDVGERLRSFSAVRQDTSFQRRLELWRGAADMALDRPVFGWGVGTFAVHQPLYVPDSRQQAEIVTGGPSLAENAHNTYLQLAAELGLPGLGLYLGILGSFFVTAGGLLPRIRRGLRRTVVVASIACAGGQAVSALSSPAWEFGECSVFFWVILGLGMAAAGIGERGLSMVPHGTGNSRTAAASLAGSRNGD